MTRELELGSFVRATTDEWSAGGNLRGGSPRLPLRRKLRAPTSPVQMLGASGRD